MGNHNIWRNREDSLRLGLSFFLILGVVLGSVFCNRMNETMKLELRVLERDWISAAALVQVDPVRLFIRILRKRMAVLAGLMLVSVAPGAALLTMAVLAYLGFSSAVVVCTLTMTSGAFGALRYLALVFPQCLFYIPLGYLLLWWMPIHGRKLTILSGLVLAVLTVLGAAAESVLNPWILSIFW